MTKMRQKEFERETGFKTPKEFIHGHRAVDPLHREIVEMVKKASPHSDITVKINGHGTPIMMMEDWRKIGDCERCGLENIMLFKHVRARDGMSYIFEDTGEPIPDELREEFWICWSCDHDIINGGPRDIDPVELAMDREQEEYDWDPVNNTPPWMNQ